MDSIPLLACKSVCFLVIGVCEGFFRVGHYIWKAVTIIEIEFERRLSFEFIVKTLDEVPGVCSAEFFEGFIYSSFRYGTQK